MTCLLSSLLTSVIFIESSILALSIFSSNFLIPFLNSSLAPNHLLFKHTYSGF
ncbi:hypothetical protein BBUWI9123_J0015 (plasmid) [Borreliella burgdorferi WI91-23]|nr:hypothetical protein BBUWI9123_J0015 [Borreliella burgdorferi WI91-23]